MAASFYNTRRWKRLRRMRLNQDPLCVRCKEAGDIVEAEIVDHIRPHKGNEALFFSYDNTQALCKPCHDKAKQQEEHSGYDRRVGVDGWPLDPRHPANRGS